MGAARTLKAYLNMAGIDVVKKEVTTAEWCFDGKPHKDFDNYNKLYQ